MVSASQLTLIDRLQSVEYLTEADLVAACRRRDLRAFEQLYLAHGPRLKSIAYHILGNRQDAEDAVQETWVKLYRGIQGFHAQSSIGTWMCRILINTCYDLARKRQREVDRSDPAAEPAAPKNQLALKVALDDTPDPSFQKTVALPAGRTLRVVHSLGNVTVRTQAKSELSVQAAIRCSADRADEARNLCGQIQIRVDESGTGVVVRTEYPHSSFFTSERNVSYSVSLDITMPETAPLELRNRFGAVTVQNLHAAAKIDSGNGRVSFLNGRGRQRIDNSFGDVEVRTNEGDVIVVNTNGMVTASDITGTLEIGNGFGDIRVTNVGRGLTIRSGNGKVDAEHVTGATQISDSFGDVRVWDAKAGVTVQNQNGKVEAMEVTGTADLRTSFSTVKFSRMGKDVTVRGQNASIAGDTVAGSVNAETSFGVVDLREIKGGARVIAGNTEIRLSGIGGEVYAKTSFAGVTVLGAGGPVTVESANGSVTAAPKPGPCKPVSLGTSFGPIRVTIPQNAGYNVTGKTSFGRIHSEAEMTVSGNISTEEIAGRIGSGGCELRLMNQNGNIDILKSH